MTLQRISKPRRFRAVLGSTPFPNFLIDRVMPRLKDTEWRVLTVIVRQTYGWRIGERLRKKADWMSHFQLKQKTGRQSAAISRAIDVLALAGLIAVRDTWGRAMRTPASRRRSHDHLLFCVHPLVDSKQFQRRWQHVQLRNSKSEDNKTNWYKIKQQQRAIKPKELKPLGPNDPPF